MMRRASPSRYALGQAQPEQKYGCEAGLGMIESDACSPGASIDVSNTHFVIRARDLAADFFAKTTIKKLDPAGCAVL
jgi:hypothetical protein